MTELSFYLEHTPIETYRLNHRTIHVKRDDLYASPPAPPLAKLRGLRILLTEICSHSISIVGCFQTRVSNIGHGLAAACLEFPSLRCIVVCPQSKRQPDPTSVEMARSLGAEIHFVPTNRLPINYAQARRYVELNGGVMLPFGMECEAGVQSVAVEAAQVPSELVRNGTVVVSCGSGVTLAGLLKGLDPSFSRIIGVSSGRSLDQIERCLIRHIRKIPNSIELVPPTMPYYESPDMRCPFACHPNYDLKAWQYLSSHANEYNDPILFWNVGG
jgi:1-aminocyclopropane-1-carboxylate deaminase/D-cysteine desulfhydrase-like pyridoxal-dependent ACC family enzyme